MCGDGDDYEEGPCFLRPKNLGLLLILLFLISSAALVLSGVDIHKIHSAESSLHLQTSFIHALEVKIRPQFYSKSKFNETHIPSSIIMVKDESLYSRAFCSFEQSSITRLDFLLQSEIDLSGQDIVNYVDNLLEFRFEVPYGMELRNHNLNSYSYSVPEQQRNLEKERSIITTCPIPECGRWDYRERIGNGNFMNADSVFISQSQVYLNTVKKLPIPITCGCSMEIPSRFSCMMPTDLLLGQKGALAMFITITYPNE